ncbi:MAG: hypothetical protein ABIJ46_00880 [bacterium]
MKKPLIFSAISAVIVSIVLSTIPVGASNSFVNVPSPEIGGSWSLSELAWDQGGRRIESFKLDRDLVAWTERDDSLGLRYLRAWNGMSTTLLATMPSADWQGSDYYAAVEGNYDVADGTVVWTAKDGSDSEIYVYRGNRVTKLTDNDYADVHPVTSNGRIAWTADRGTIYNLMVEETDGTVRSADQYHVMDYAFSGPNLYWMNIKSGSDLQRVLVDSGSGYRAVGYGEVRPLDYPFFTVDGEGGASWSRLERYGNLELNVFYVSDGVRTSEVLRRERWANDVRVEDLRDGFLLASSADLRTKNKDDVTLVKTNGSWEDIVQVKTDLAKVRFTDDAYVRHVMPETSSPLIVSHDDGYETWISETRIERDVFDADADTVVGAMRDRGGVVLYHDREVTQVNRPAKARVIATRNDTAAWIEGTSGNSVLVVARPGILVGNSSGAKTVAGRLVKSSVAATVYLATPGGERFAFPTEGEFYSWYGDFSSLIELPVEDLSAMPLAGVVLYPVGTLIKSPTSPKVYAVSGTGRISWIADADIVALHYGPSWNRTVHDLSDAFLAAYQPGRAIANSSEYYTIAAAK